MAGSVSYYIGLDIGGTKCAASLASVCGDKAQILCKDVFPTADKTPLDVLNTFCIFIDSKITQYKIEGIGISCGGPLDSRRGIVLSPPSLPLWDGIEVVAFFEDRYGIPTHLQNDANACAVAEKRFGAGRGCDHMIFLTFGTGLGAGLILNGKLYAGASDNAGEVGHVRLTKNGPVGYHKVGSCEGYCSGSGIARLAEQFSGMPRYKKAYAAFLNSIGGERPTAKNMAEGARCGDPFCKAVYKKAVRCLAAH